MNESAASLRRCGCDAGTLLAFLALLTLTIRARVATMQLYGEPGVPVMAVVFGLFPAASVGLLVKYLKAGRTLSSDSVVDVVGA